MTTSGEEAGSSHLSRSSSSSSGRLTHPSVGLPISAWMKMADPAPGTTGPVLYRTTAKLGYATVSVHNASLSPPNGGASPHGTC